MTTEWPLKQCPTCKAEPIRLMGFPQHYTFSCPWCGASGGTVAGPPVAHATPQSDAQRAAAVAVDQLGRHAGVVLVKSHSDPYGVELGANMRPSHVIALLEMALLKIKRSLEG